MDDTINFVDGQVQVCFTKGEHPLILGDALWFTQEEYDALTPEEIEAMKQARYDNWLVVINSVE